MKKLYLFFVLAFSIQFAAFAQPTLKAKISFIGPTSLNFLPLKNDDVLYAARDGGIKLSRFSSKGELIWSKLFTQKLPVEWLQTNKTEDDGALVLATYQEQDTYNIYFLALKLDKAGSIVWQASFTENDYYESAVSRPTICEAADGSVYVGAGDLFNFFQVVKFNKSGKLLWHKRFNYGGAYGHSLEYMTSDENNDVLLKVSYAGCEGYCGYSVIFKVSKTGNFLWNQEFPQNFNVRSFEALGNDKLGILFNYTPYGKNSVSYVKSVFDHNTGTSQSSIFKLDAFTLASLYKKESANYAKGIKLDDFYLTDDFSVVRQYIDTLYSYDTKNRICPNYTKPKLKAVRDTTYRISTRTIEQAADTGFKLTNIQLAVKSSAPGVAIVCQDKAGNDNNFKNQYTSAPKFSIYPNPVNNQFVLQGLGDAHANLQIFSLSGLLMQEVKNYCRGAVNISKLKPGNYMLKISTGGSTYNKAFVKQ